MWFCNNIINFYRPIEQIKKIVIATANCNRTECAMLTMHIQMKTKLSLTARVTIFKNKQQG